MELSRRNFLKSAGAVASAAGVGALASIRVANADEAADSEDIAAGEEDSEEESGTITYDETINWNGQYDVVVVGFGAAGASSAIAASDAGASVLLLDKAPLGNEGGNSRYCGQLFANGRGDVDETKSYLTQLAGDFEIPDDMLEFFAEGIANIEDTYASVLDVDPAEFYYVDETAESSWASVLYLIGLSPEYPEFVTNEDNPVIMTTLHDGRNDGYMWEQYRQQVKNRSDSIDVWLESPVVDLIQEPNTKTILGVTVSRGGEELNIRATNGVVLSCGGFENNTTMKKDYLGIATSTCFGTEYNTGDGINMAKAAGADLWHMHVYEGSFGFGGVAYLAEEGSRGDSASAPSDTGAYFLVGTDGYRFLNEAEIMRHGHIYHNGTWDNPWYPSTMFVVFDETNVSYLDTLDSYGNAYVQADTLTELAELAGFKEGILEQTVEDFNSFAEAGYDPAFNRDASTMQAFGDGPYYAAELEVGILNTQGGPRRNANAEIVDVDGNAIPHLYGAGECGGITSNMYQGGCNMAECLLFGQLAGTNAAAEKDPLDAYVVEAVESDLVYTLGSVNDLLDVTSVEEYETECAENEYIGSATGMGGDLIVKVTTDDGATISNLEVLEEYETEDVGGAALESLVPAIIEAGTTEGVDAVSGATVTSNALFDAIAEALEKAAE